MAHEKRNQGQDSTGVSRRDLFNIIGTVPAMAVATAGIAAAEMPAAHSHMAAAQQAAPAGPYKRQTFDDHQWRTVRVLCDLIIPADERSGSASQAGVPEFLDDWIAFRTKEDENQNLQAEIFGGLMWLDRQSRALAQKDFADASPDQQKQILDRVAYPERAAKEDHAWVMFFNAFRNLTVSGFFSSKMGVADLPYLGNTAVAHWQGCDPKVWAIIEDRLKNGYEGIVKSPSHTTASTAS
jgi:gluconate 2-dehydrogenase gamma chain